MAIETAKQRYQKRLSALRNERSSWEPHWRELADYFLPRKGRWLFNNVNRGDKRNQLLIDSEPRLAARTLASGMMAGLTSPARPWFRLITPDPEMMEFGPVKQWLYDVERRMRDVFAKSNLYKPLPTVYGEMGVFGVCPMIGLEDPRSLIRFFPLTIGSYYLAQNEQHRVDTLYREVNMTVRQMVRMFGEKACSPTVRSMWQNGSTEQWIRVIHISEPNEDRVITRADNRNMPFRSAWFEAGDGNGDGFLRQSGFNEFPVMAPRWDPTAEDVYSGSPGMDALGDAKALQYQQKQKAKAIDKHVDPPMQAPTSLRNERASLLPGDITYVDVASGMQGFVPAYQIKPEIQALLLDMQEMRDRINRTFYVDLFLMLAMSDRRQMTATEVAERHEEKLLMLGPVLERLNDELLDPLIDRTFSVMFRAGALPPPPPELEGVDLKVEYISILAQAQRMVGLGAVDRLYQFAGAVAGADPTVLDKLDHDQAVDEYADMLGVPPGIVRPDDAVARLRQQRAQAQAVAAAAQAAPGLSKAAKDLAETPVDGDSALSRALGGV